MPRAHKKGLRSTVYERNKVELCRGTIKTSQLINRLQDNGLADKEFLTAGQIQSIKIALDKSLPNLVSQEIAITDQHPFAVLPAVIPSETDWEEAFTPAPKATEH